MTSAIKSVAATRPAAPRPTHVRPVRAIEAEKTLFRDGDPVTHLFEVISGTLRMTRLLETGRRQVVAFAHAGDIVGFAPDGRHRADCEALTPVTVIAHRASALDDGRSDPDLRQRLRTAALAEIATLQDHLLLLARKGACGKLASFIGDMADRHGRRNDGRQVVDLAMPRSDIADYLCMTVETVSRTLTRMRSEKLIALDGPHRIVILDKEGLQRMAGAE